MHYYAHRIRFAHPLRVAWFTCILNLVGIAASQADDPAPGISGCQRYITARDLNAHLQKIPVSQGVLSEKSETDAVVRVDPTVKYQTILGFGGAFTDAATHVILEMPKAKQEEILRAYFDPDQGNHYTLCRTHINSCDFSINSYSYDEHAGDTELKDFNIARDRQSLIPIIKRALAMSHNGFKLFASPWSPPAWMKTNGDMLHGGKLKPEDRSAWALYYTKYIHAYADEGIPIWGLTVQNEPAAVQPWESCIYTGPEERDFVRDYLGPTLQKEGLSSVKLMVWDHNRDLMYDRAKDVYDDPKAAQYVWGTAFHWYVQDDFDNVQRVHDAWPDKNLLLTEGCQEGGIHDTEWAVGERYGEAMKQDLNHWSVGWTDWNIVLDQTGGPNHVGNLTSAPIIADTTTGEVRYEPSYYYIGQFSRFVRPGAVRILSAPTNENLETTAFQNPDGQLVLVVMNRTELPIQFKIAVGDRSVETVAPQRSIQTLVVDSK